MSKKEPPEIFDIDAIAARNIDDAKLRAKAFDLAVRLVQGYHGEQRPAFQVAELANQIFAWFHTGQFVESRK